MTDENDFIKLVLEEVRINNRKLDEFRVDVDKSIGKVFARAERLDARVEQAEDELEALHNITYGNDVTGVPGISTKVSLVESKLETIQAEQVLANKIKVEDNKNSTTIKVAKIAAVSAGVIAFVKALADLLI